MHSRESEVCLNRALAARIHHRFKSLTLKSDITIVIRTSGAKTSGTFRIWPLVRALGILAMYFVACPDLWGMATLHPSGHGISSSPKTLMLEAKNNLKGQWPGLPRDPLKLWAEDHGWQLHCSGTMELSVTRVKLDCAGDRTSSGSEPRTWNELLQELRTITNLTAKHTSWTSFL